MVRTVARLCVACGIVALVSISSRPVAAEESTAYKLGRIAAYANYCRYFAQEFELQRAFGGHPDYVKGFRQNDLSGADSVRGLPCDKVEEVLDQILVQVRERSGGRQVHCLLPEAETSVEMREADCRAQDGMPLAAPKE